MSFRLEIHYKPDRYGLEPLPRIKFAEDKKALDRMYESYTKDRDVAFVRVGYANGQDGQKEGDDAQ